MTQRERSPRTATRVATTLILLVLLGNAGCMIRRPAVTRPAGDVVSAGDPTGQPADPCERFACEP